jgi:hypothetical protein
MLGLRAPSTSGRARRVLSRAAVAILLGGLLVAGIRASQPRVARGATPGELIHLSLWPAGQGRIEVRQNGVPVIATQQDGSPIQGAGGCDFLYLLEHPDPCDAVVVAGTPVTLTATTEPDAVVPNVTLPPNFQQEVPDFPVPNPQFMHWTVFGCGTANPCTFTPDGSDWVGAIFSPLQLEVGMSGSGTVGVQRADGSLDPGFTCPPQDDPLDFFDTRTVCHGLYAADSSVVLVSSPGESPITWGSGCDVDAGNSAVCRVAMSNLRTFAVVRFGGDPMNDPTFALPAPPFKITPQVRVVVSGSGHGVVAGSGFNCGLQCANPFDYQDRVTLQATPDPGSQFIGWQGVCSTAPSCSFSAGSATLVRAVFDVSPPPPQTTTAVTATVVTEPGRPAFHPRIGKVGTRHRAGRRIVVVPLVLDRTARVTVRLTRRGRTVLLKRLTAQRGRTLLQLPIPKRLKRGGYTLLVRIVAGTDARTFSTSVAIGR